MLSYEQLTVQSLELSLTKPNRVEKPSQVDMLSNQAQALTRERQKLEAEAAKRRSQQSTTNKAVKNLVRQARTVVEQLHEIEMGETRTETTRPCFFSV